MRESDEEKRMRIGRESDEEKRMIVGGGGEREREMKKRERLSGKRRSV